MGHKEKKIGKVQVEIIDSSEGITRAESDECKQNPHIS
jgi:hypothetical protein